MRFINSKTQKFHLFDTPNVPEYAIFSHVWGNEEVSYQDMLDVATREEKQGFAKVKAVCEKAAHDGMKYVWVDTCCINKESSAELSEAINLMYEWYRNAQVCYVYLFDVPSTEDPNAIFSSFSRSKWFTRGWTLQELIAPSSVIFYGDDWEEIGTKASLRPVISTVTGIDSAVILSNHRVDICVAQIMSWAAQRQTTKEEDIAYCLMGLFNVNMPIIYGEGRNAFIRLQEEIIKSSNDQSIFAWKSTTDEERGPIAQSPTEFCDARNIIRKDHEGEQSHYSMVNRGLLIELPISKVQGKQDVFLASLGCAYKNDPNQNIAIYLKKGKGKHFARTSSSTLKPLRFGNIKPSSLFMKKQDPPKLGVNQRMSPPSQYKIIVRPFVPEETGFVMSKVHPPEFWTEVGAGEGVLTMKNSGTSMIMMFQAAAEPGKDVFAIMLGIHNYSIWSDIVTDIGSETAENIRDSYYGGKRSSKLWENLDRSSKEIQGQQLVMLSIRKAVVSGQSQYVTEMSIKDSIQSGTERSSQLQQWVRPQVEYMFWVTISPSISAHHFVVSEALPTTGDPYWVEKNGLHFLCLDRSGDSGILLFKNENTHEEFAVMVGVHNYEVWTDIVTNFGNESATAIRKSYYEEEGGRNDTLWLQRSISSSPLEDERLAKVMVRSTNNTDFMTEISIERHGIGSE